MGNFRTLAIEGGKPIRQTPMPPRGAIGQSERGMILEVLDYYDSLGLDPGYQGKFEQEYCKAFCKYHDGGFADAVATGSLAVYLALKALRLPKNSEILVSPITDPGSISTIIEAGLCPKLVDAAPGSYNIGPDEILAKLSDNVSGALVVHASGQAVDIEPIEQLLKSRGVRLIEDCSQAHGAARNGKKVGCFGDIAAFSTMYRKTSITGGSGGLVFTRDIELYHMALAFADRGKPSWRENFDDRDPTEFLFPAMNLHTDEISCAIGIASLARLDATRIARLSYVNAVEKELRERQSVCSALKFGKDDSPFICPVFVDLARVKCDKRRFAEAVMAEGINLNPHYMYLVRDWPWVESYLSDTTDTPVAREMRDSSFCLYVNENYGHNEINDTLAAIEKVEAYYAV